MLKNQLLLPCRLVNLISRLFPAVSQLPFHSHTCPACRHESTLPTPKVRHYFFTLTSSCKEKLHKGPACLSAPKSAGPSEPLRTLYMPLLCCWAQSPQGPLIAVLGWPTQQPSSLSAGDLVPSLKGNPRPPKTLPRPDVHSLIQQTFIRAYCV